MEKMKKNIYTHIYRYVYGASQVALVVKNLLADAGDIIRDVGSIPQKISWRRVWQPTPVFLPGESHGQRNLVGYIVHRISLCI